MSAIDVIEHVCSPVLVIREQLNDVSKCYVTQGTISPILGDTEIRQALF
jgi:hypothetical protein